MSVSDKYVLTLMEASTGVSDVYETLAAAKEIQGENLDRCYVFFGTRGIDSTMTKESYDQLTNEEKGKYLERTKVEDGVTTYSYYYKETDFNVVSGFEGVDFANSPDKSIYYNPSDVRPAQDGVGSVGAYEIGKWIEIKDTYEDNGELKDQTTRWISPFYEQKIVGAGDCYILYIPPKARIMDNYVPRNFDATKDDVTKSYWPIILINVIGKIVPWTTKNRYGVIGATYYGDANPQDYTIYNSNRDLYGDIPGINY